MIEQLEFTEVEGENSPCDITVYAISTCGFCKRALAYLRDKNIAFRYVYVDKLDKEVKGEVKKDLYKIFDEHNEMGNLGFPFCVIDEGEKIIVGFTEDKWNKKIFDKE